MATNVNWTTRLTRRKPIARVEDIDQANGGLERSMSLLQLVMLGEGATIGTGIFFAMSETVPKAGPAVVVSFLIAGLVAGLTALCYAEIASSIPVSGSSYSFAYVTMGEGMAFLIAGCLVLEYSIGTGAVAIGWADYLSEVLEISSRGMLHIPSVLLASPLKPDPASTSEFAFIMSGSIVNLPAFVLVWVCAFLLMRGSKESAIVNTIMVSIKLFVLIIFIVLSATAFTGANFEPFMPKGIQGVSTAAGIIFFSYVGLDAVSTASEEVVDPKKNIPRAIILALVIVTSVYLGVAITSIGAQSIADFTHQQAGLAEILRKVTGSNIWPLVFSLGAVISVFSVTLIGLFGQTRIIHAMSRDGLIPAAFHRRSGRSQSPNFATIVVAAFCSLIAGLVPSSLLWGLVSIGTLVAFATVSSAVIILRQTSPSLERPYVVPFYPYLPIASILACAYLLLSLGALVWVLFAGWLIIGGIFYFLYVARHSALERGKS